MRNRIRRKSFEKVVKAGEADVTGNKYCGVPADQMHAAAGSFGSMISGAENNYSVTEGDNS